MSKTTRSEQEIEEIKYRILEEALTILRDEGFDNLSMYKLGKQTGMTAANLYNYYKNKDQLIIAIHKKTFEMLYNMLTESIAPEKDPMEKLKKIIRTFVHFGKTYPNFYDLMFNRKVPQVSDYQGTREELMSRDEYQSSIRNLHLVVEIGKEILSSHPEFKGMDLELSFIKMFSELHGIISLNNSGLLQVIVSNHEILLQNITENLLTPYLSR